MLRCKIELTSMFLHIRIEIFTDIARKISIECISLFQQKIHFVFNKKKIVPESISSGLTFRIIKTKNLLFLEA